jgi:pSer/pThr/pTyr-binding forkhead associated (FHA) protein
MREIAIFYIETIITKLLTTQIVLSDLGSKNGTFLNSHPDRLVKDKQYMLHDGDTIEFGSDVQVRTKVILRCMRLIYHVCDSFES